MRKNISGDISHSSNPVSATPPIQDSGSEPSQEVPDKLWSQTTELLDRFKSSGSITVTKVSTVSHIEKSASQSPVLAVVPEEETLTNKTTSIHGMPPVNKNPIPKSQGGENWQ